MAEQLTYHFTFAIALFHIRDDIIQATDEGKYTVLVLLNYSKAFDTINYEMLLNTYKSCLT